MHSGKSNNARDNKDKEAWSLDDVTYLSTVISKEKDIENKDF